MSNSLAIPHTKKIISDIRQIESHLIFDDKNSDRYCSLDQIVQVWNEVEKHDFAGYKSIFTKTSIKHFKESVKEITSLTKSITSFIYKAETLCDDEKKLIEFLTKNDDENISLLSSSLTKLLEIYCFDNFYAPLLNLVNLVEEAANNQVASKETKKSKMLKSLKAKIRFTAEINFAAFSKLDTIYSTEKQKSICIDIRDIIYHLRHSLNHGPSARMIDQHDSDMSYKERMALMTEYIDEMNKLHYNFSIIAIVQNEKKKNGEIWEVHADVPGAEEAFFFSAHKSLGLACLSAYDKAKEYSEIYGTPIKFIELIDEQDD